MLWVGFEPPIQVFEHAKSPRPLWSAVLYICIYIYRIEWLINDEFESALKEAVLAVGTEEIHDIPHWYPGQIRTDCLRNTAAERYRVTRQCGIYSVEKDVCCGRWIAFFIFLSPFLFISNLLHILFPSFHPSILSTFFLSYLPSILLTPLYHLSSASLFLRSMNFYVAQIFLCFCCFNVYHGTVYSNVHSHARQLLSLCS
jgi:hypothetical protein